MVVFLLLCIVIHYHTNCSSGCKYCMMQPVAYLSIFQLSYFQMYFQLHHLSQNWPNCHEKCQQYMLMLKQNLQLYFFLFGILFIYSFLQVTENAFHVKKGINPDVDSYSAFWDNDKLSKTELSSILAQQRVTDVYVCGLAYDVCVGQ